MANKLYPKGAEKILRAGINFDSDTIKVVLIASSYTYSASHEFLSDISASVIGAAQTLTGKSTTGGVFDAADVDFGAIAAGSTMGSYVMYKDTGSAATSPLIEYNTDVTGFPAATNGGGISIPWNNGAGRIISLVA